MSSKSKSIFQNLKKTNVKRFALFFITTFLVLIFLKLSKSYKQNIALKIELYNTDEEIVIKNDSLNHLNAYVEASGFSLLPLMFKDYKVIKIDAKTQIEKNKNQYLFDTKKNKFIVENLLGASYKLISLKPDSLLLNYNKMATKRVPIVLKTKINYAIGYDLKGQFVMSTDSVKLVGPASDLQVIKYIETELLEIKSANKNIDQTLNLNNTQFGSVDIYPKLINVKGDVVKFTEGTLEIPVNVINRPNTIHINYFPKVVSISYYVDLDRYSNIKAEDFRIECDFGSVGEEQTDLIPKLVKKPDYVKRVQIKQKRIDFIRL